MGRPAAWPVPRVRLASAKLGAAVPRSSVGLALILAGVALAVIGLIVWAGGLSWFGRLPGDIRIERPNVRIYVPITSMIVISIVLTVVVAIVRRLR